MKENLIKLGFEKWLAEQELAPYFVMFWDTPKFIQLAYIQKFLRENNKYITVLPFINIEDSEELQFYYSSVDTSDSRGIYCNADDLGISEENFQNFEDALEAGIVKTLDLC